MSPDLKFVLVLLAGVFGTYRTAYMVAREDGPFEIFAGIRGKFVGNSWIAAGIRCFYCVSFWTALLFAGLLAAFGYIVPAEIIFFWPGLAGAAILAHKYWLRE